jgi:ATP/maltotriose-dependent transcriptional regulator MalT
VLIEEGQLGKAEALAGHAAQEFQTEKATLRESQARAVLAHSQLAQGKLPEAQRSINDAENLLGRSDDPETRFLVIRIGARVRAAMGKTEEAVKSLEGSVAELTKVHRVYDRFEGRLALGDIEVKSGKTASGKARLVALEKDATTQGFLLIGRKAHASMNQH